MKGNGEQSSLGCHRCGNRFDIQFINRWWMLIILYPTLTVPFCTWIMIGYFASIPKELDEAAIMDGASYMQVLTRIFIPVALPGIIAATIFAFTVSWAQFLYPLAFTTSADQLVLPVGIITTLIKGDVFNWGQIMTGALLSAGAFSADKVAHKIHLRGSTTLQPMAQHVAEQYMLEHAGAIVVVSGGGSHYGHKGIVDGTTDIAMFSATPSEEQQKQHVSPVVDDSMPVLARLRHVYDFVYHPISYVLRLTS